MSKHVAARRGAEGASMSLPLQANTGGGAFAAADLCTSSA